MASDTIPFLVGYRSGRSSSLHQSHTVQGFRSSATAPEPPADARQDLFYTGSAHLMTVAPAGAGKGRGAVIPTLLDYPGSVVVNDPKAENYHVTARARREMGQQVIRLDPFGVAGKGGDAFNMLDVFRLPGMDIETEAQMIAELFSQGNRGVKDPFWDLNACSLLSGIICYVISVLPPEERSFQAVRNALFGDDPIYSLAVILDTVGKQIPKSAYQQISSFLSMSDRDTRPGVLATAHSYFSSLLSEDVNQATCRSSFALEDFRDGKPMTIYLILPPDKLTSHRALIKMWVGVLLKTITSRQQIPDHPTLFLLDEVGQLGYFQYLYSIITLCRGYGLKCWTIWQDFQQLESNYPYDWQTLINNCGMVQFFGGKNYQIARKVEAITGVPTAQIMQLPGDHQITLIDGEVVFAQKLDYLSGASYKGRFDPNPFYSRGGLSTGA